MSNKTSILSILLGLTLSGMASAQQHHGSLMRYRNYPVMTAEGPVSQAEWKQSGGNIDIYRQLMAQKAMVAEQQAYEKMMVQQQKNLQAAIKSGQINPNATNNTAMTSIFQPTKGKKKRHGIDESKKVTSDSTASKSASTPSAKEAQGKDESTDGSADDAKDAAKTGTTSTTKSAKAKS